MNVRYKFHPPVYAMGENEKFYGDMEARGWRLIKRGSHLSKFVPVEPSRARYRVEIVPQSFLDLPEGMPEEQLAVYADCGWEHVADWRNLYIFRAPEGSDAPEFYADPRQQADALKTLRKNDLWGWVVLAAMLLLNGLMVWALGRDPAETAAELWRGWVENTALVLLYGTALLGSLFEAVYGDWKFSRLYRRLKKGVPMDHAPRGLLWYKIPSGSFRVLTALFALLLVLQWVGTEKYDLPQTADGPYILLEDLGYEGERTEDWVNHRPSRVEHSRSLLAEQWSVREFMERGNGLDQSQLWLYVDTYRLSPLMDREAFARTLMEDSVMAHGAESYEAVEQPGLDAAWMVEGGMEVVAIRGEYVFYVEHLPRNYGDNQKLEAALTALAALELP